MSARVRFMRPSLVVPGVVVAVTLAGCSSGKSAVVAQDPIATETPVVVPSPTPAVAADEHTLKGSEAFVRTYILETNRAYATGDVEFLRARSAKECGTCANMIRTVVNAYADGGRIVDSVQQIHAVQSLTARLQSPQDVGVILSAPDAEVLAGNGRVAQVLPGAPKTSFKVTLLWLRHHWLVSSIQAAT